MNYCPDCERAVRGDTCDCCGKTVICKESKTGKYLDSVFLTEYPSNFKLKGFFSEVLKRHKMDDYSEGFVAGTKYNNKSTGGSLPKPWLYTRVFAVLLIAFLLCLIGGAAFGNSNFYPMLFITGSLVVPFSCLFLMFELNIEKTINLLVVLLIFLIGGLISLVFTVTLYALVGMSSNTFILNVSIAVIEELTKIVVVAASIKLTKARGILSGLLVGAAVGCGFACFESAGYAFQYASSMSVMLNVICMRAVLSFGGHISWAAIEGVAIIVAMGNEDFNVKKIFTKRPLLTMLYPVLLHFCWDFFASVISSQFVVYLILFLLVFAAMFVIVNLVQRGVFNTFIQALPKEETTEKIVEETSDNPSAENIVLDETGAVDAEKKDEADLPVSEK